MSISGGSGERVRSGGARVLDPNHGSVGPTGGTLRGVFAVISGYEILVVVLAVVALGVIIGTAVIGVFTRLFRGDVREVHGPPTGSPRQRVRTWRAGRSPGR